nr:MAG TPA: hypothetical protein [Caudoviricetes sp.]
MIKNPLSFLLGLLTAFVIFACMLNYAVSKTKPYICFYHKDFNQTECCKNLSRNSLGHLQCSVNQEVKIINY